MSIIKKGYCISICVGLTLYLTVFPTQPLAEEKPQLYVIYDSTESMESAKSAIADLLGAIDEKLQSRSNIRQNVRFYNFRESIIDRETKVLSTLSRDLAASITHSEKENILPVLESLASTPELNDAVVLIFTNGINKSFFNADTDKLINNLSNRRTQFHFFGPYSNWCDGELAIAVNQDNSALNVNGTEIQCDDLTLPRNPRAQEFFIRNKLATLAFKTGGMVWPIFNFDQIGKGRTNAPVEAIEVAAQKLTEILLFKTDKSLTATVDYPKQVYVGETVYFEVTANGSEQNVGPTTSWRWDFDGDGQFDDLGTFVSKTFNVRGEFTVRLELSNSDVPAVVRNLHLPVKVVE